MRRLPDDLVARAFHARNGELAWTRDDAVRVAEALAAVVLAAAEAEALAPPPLRPRLRYHLRCTCEEAYRPIRNRRPPC